MKTLVLGGKGFVGTSLIKQLSMSENATISLSRKSVGHEFENIVYLYDTYDNVKLLTETLKDVDTVIHIASDTTPGSSAQQPTLEVVNNLTPTIRLLELLQNYHGIHLIFVSSGGALYSDNTGPPYSEVSELGPPSYHGAGKIAVEYFLHAYNKQTGNPVTILRPSNLYGPGQVAKRGFGIIPTLFDAILNDKAFTIWGDGATSRDFLHINDFVTLCLEVIASNPKNDIRTYNAGSGIGISVSDLCDLIERITRSKINKISMPIRDVDKIHVYLDTGKVNQTFNWQPSVSLERGLRDLWSQLC